MGQFSGSSHRTAGDFAFVQLSKPRIFPQGTIWAGFMPRNPSPEALHCYLRMFIVFCAYLQLLVQVLGGHGVVVVFSFGADQEEYLGLHCPHGIVMLCILQTIALRCRHRHRNTN